MDASNWDYCDWYMDGALYVCVLTGMPEQSVQIGTGDTPQEAYEALEGTAIQSVGRDCGRAAAMSWAHGAGWISAEDLESIDTPERA